MLEALLWDWRTATGQIKDMAARTLLVKLEQRGLVELPARRCASPNRMRHKRVVAVSHAQEAVGMSGRDGRHCGEKFPQAARPKKIWLRALHPLAREHLVPRELPSAQRAGLASHAGVRCSLKTPLLGSLYEAFQKVPDPRARKGYPIGAVLTLVALGLLSGAVHLSAIVRGAQKLKPNQRAQLRLRFKKGTRFRAVPGYDVFREVLQRVDLDALARVLIEWLQAHAGQLLRTLAVGGKTIRDQLGLIVTLVDTEDGSPVALAADVRGNGHELKATQKLLASPEVNLLNATVTADSLHCQDQSAHLVVREKGGDYVFQIRDNPPTLHPLAQRQLATTPPFFVEGDGGHGRSEHRELSRVATDAQATDFPETRQLVKVRNLTTHKKDGRSEDATRHFVTSLSVKEAGGPRLHRTIRSHWGCQSKHWQRDVCWREDECLLRSANAACAVALIRTTLQALLRKVGRPSLPSVFEDVAARRSLGLGWLTQRHFRR